MVGVITGNDETACSEEVRDLSNMTKTKELIADYRKMRAKHAPIHIDGAVVKRVESFKFLGVYITSKLSWSKHTQDSCEVGPTMPIPLQETDKP